MDVGRKGESLGGFSPFRVNLQRRSIAVDNGPWADWMTVEPGGWRGYSGGRGGQTVAFRSRGVDQAGNVEPWPAQPDAITRIETDPPILQFGPLPAFTQGQIVDLFWNIFDPGGSGVYDVDFEVQDVATGEWQRRGSADTTATYNGELGHTYRSRVRGVDKAGNQSAWAPAGDRLAETTLYRWGMTGTVVDNGGAPVPDAAVTLSSPLLAPAQSDAGGRYGAYTAEKWDSYLLGASKTGYGVAAPTRLSAVQQMVHEMVLPPVDDVLGDGGFEDGLGQWVAGGAYPPFVSATERHAGRSAAQLRPAMPARSMPVQMSNSRIRDEWVTMTVSPDGAAYMLWRAVDGTITYGWSGADRAWGATPAPTLPFVNWGSLADTPDSTVWLAGDGYKYGDYPGAGRRTTA